MTDAQANGKPIIKLRELVKNYKTGEGELEVLKNLSLEIENGDYIGILGPSGAGKSTLLNMITGVDKPTEGEIWVTGEPIHALGENKLAQWRGRSVGVVFQFFQLLPTLTIAENVIMPMEFCKMYRPRERRERALHLLESLSIADQADKLPHALSGGQQQRAAIARALANDPPIVVADEPTGNLDSKTGAAVFDIFTSLVKDGKTVIMVSHESTLSEIVHRSIVLVDGVIVEDERTRVAG
ncbi:MAG: ABC transporter ATP-binding protein [Anaerolineales bacterium]|nr:ABC transporter ATP-binding protein [Anaerolineales bacterium]